MIYYEDKSESKGRVLIQGVYHSFRGSLHQAAYLTLYNQDAIYIPYEGGFTPVSTRSRYYFHLNLGSNGTDPE